MLCYTCALNTTESTNCIKFWQDRKDKYPKLYRLTSFIT